MGKPYKFPLRLTPAEWAYLVDIVRADLNSGGLEAGTVIHETAVKVRDKLERLVPGA